MKYKLINPPNPRYSAKQQVLINRGIAEQDLVHYMNLTNDDINDPFIFGENEVRKAADLLIRTLETENSTICVIVDSDCDGFTSSAILINYLYDLNPEAAKNRVYWFFHEGKQHGLEDAVKWIENIDAQLVIIPDAGSNDISQIEQLHNEDREIIILDHHDLEVEPSPYAYLINSQLPQYPNKELSGAGVVYQFCRAIDKIYDYNYADWYLDLCALGLNY